MMVVRLFGLNTLRVHLFVVNVMLKHKSLVLPVLGQEVRSIGFRHDIQHVLVHQPSVSNIEYVGTDMRNHVMQFNRCTFVKSM